MAKAIDYPEVMKYWDYETNKKDPAEVEDTFTGLINFKCEKGHKWKKPFARYVNQKSHECYECNKDRVRANNYPELIKFFNQDLNPSINLSKLSVYDNKIKVTWKCPICQKEWITTIINRKGKNDCPYCNGHYRATNYAEEYPKLLERYSNKNPKPLNEIKGSENKIPLIWNCPIHGEYKTTINNLLKNYNSKSFGCPYCWNQKRTYEDSFGFKHPDLVKELHPDENINLFKVGELSTKDVKWTCSKCGETFIDKISHRALGATHCAVDGLKDKRPDLEEFYSEENEMLFKKISYKSNKNYIWKCNKGHKFKLSADAMVAKEAFDCPYCENRELLVGVNDVKTKFPELVKEFAIENCVLGKTLESFMINDPTVVLWRCPDCGKIYPLSIRERVTYIQRHKESCPNCRGLSRTYGQYFG